MPEKGSFYAPEKDQPVQKDEEELLERGLTHDFYMPAEDEHLEDLYDWQQSGDEDF